MKPTTQNPRPAAGRLVPEALEGLADEQLYRLTNRGMADYWEAASAYSTEALRLALACLPIAAAAGVSFGAALGWYVGSFPVVAGASVVLLVAALSWGRAMRSVRRARLESDACKRDTDTLLAALAQRARGGESLQ